MVLCAPARKRPRAEGATTATAEAEDILPGQRGGAEVYSATVKPYIVPLSNPI